MQATTDDGLLLGSKENEEGKIFLMPNNWAVISGIAGPRARQTAMASVTKYLLKDYGTLLNYPAFTQPAPGCRLRHPLCAGPARKRRRVHPRRHLVGLGLHPGWPARTGLRGLPADLPAQPQRRYRHLQGRALRHPGQHRRPAVGVLWAGRLDLVHRFGPMAAPRRHPLDLGHPPAGRWPAGRSVHSGELAWLQGYPRNSAMPSTRSRSKTRTVSATALKLRSVWTGSMIDGQVCPGLR